MHNFVFNINYKMFKWYSIVLDEFFLSVRYSQLLHLISTEGISKHIKTCNRSVFVIQTWDRFYHKYIPWIGLLQVMIPLLQ